MADPIQPTTPKPSLPQGRDIEADVRAIAVSLAARVPGTQADDPELLRLLRAEYLRLGFRPYAVIVTQDIDTIDWMWATMGIIGSFDTSEEARRACRAFAIGYDPGQDWNPRPNQKDDGVTDSFSLGYPNGYTGSTTWVTTMGPFAGPTLQGLVDGLHQRTWSKIEPL